MENKISLEKWYSALNCFLPVKYEDDESGYQQLGIKDLLVGVGEAINEMHNLYDASYESQETCNPEEKNFILAMRGVFERLDKITAITHIIDGIKPTTEDVIF